MVSGLPCEGLLDGGDEEGVGEKMSMACVRVRAREGATAGQAAERRRTNSPLGEVQCSTIKTVLYVPAVLNILFNVPAVHCTLSIVLYVPAVLCTLIIVLYVSAVHCTLNILIYVLAVHCTLNSVLYVPAVHCTLNIVLYVLAVQFTLKSVLYVPAVHCTLLHYSTVHFITFTTITTVYLYSCTVVQLYSLSTCCSPPVSATGLGHTGSRRGKYHT